MLSGSFSLGGAPVTDNPQITAPLSATLSTAQKCSASETVENYSLLGEQLNELASTAGQSLLSHGGYQPLIDKLEKGTQLTDAEFKTVRSLIVGDAFEEHTRNPLTKEAGHILARIIKEMAP
jgi:hypothetical protein